MKKILVSMLCVLAMFSVIILASSKVYATNATVTEERKHGTEQLVEIKENVEKKLEDYKQDYGDVYGVAAYILNGVRIYSIPFCFVGIAVGAVYQYVIGIRKLDERDKGFAMIIGFVTILVIAQILPLVFAIVVKGWRG